MTTAQITDTSIINKDYCSRGLIVNRATSHPCVRDSDGTLWVAIRERHLVGHINLYRSKDGGFTWQNIFKGDWPTGLGWGGESPILGTEAAVGAFIHLQVLENLNKIIMWHTFHYNGDNTIRAWPFIFNKTTGERNLTEVPSNAPDYKVGADSLCMKFPYNENMLFIVYIAAGSLVVRSFYPNQITLYRTSTALSGGWTPTFDAVARQDGLIDIAIVQSTALKYLRYNDLTQTYSASVTVATSVNTIGDVGISRDGNGHLLITYTDYTGSTSSLKYARSTDNGVTWVPVTIPTVGTPFDAMTAAPTSRLINTAGLNGFLLSYVDQVGAGPIRTYVRTLIGGALGAAKEIATVSNPGVKIMGVRFFETPTGKQLDLSDPGQARVAFQVGEGNSNLGLDSISVRIGQEELAESAYPSLSTSLPAADVPTLFERLVTVNVLAGPEENQDYFAAGAVGAITRKYLKAFASTGTYCVIRRYNPTVAAETNDRSAYGTPTSISRPIILTPMTYEWPFPQSSEDFTAFVERDARKIHLPPDLWLEREFILNAGNFLKRTIWTMLFDGNEYEISQVVPSFVSGKITHYSANAYVVGSSNDPFSRKTLVSET